MNRTSEVRDIELRRLAELEKRAAQFGPHTEPSVLIEIQDLHHKYPEIRQLNSGNRDTLDYDFLMNTVAAALQRLTELEQKFKNDGKARFTRQLIHDLWMVVITTIVFVSLLLLIAR